MRENQRKSNENRHLDDRVEPEATPEKAVRFLPVSRGLGAAPPLDECGDEAEVRDREAESEDRGQECEIAIAGDADPASTIAFATNAMGRLTAACRAVHVDPPTARRSAHVGIASSRRIQS